MALRAARVDVGAVARARHPEELPQGFVTATAVEVAAASLALGFVFREDGDEAPRGARDLVAAARVVAAAVPAKAPPTPVDTVARRRLFGCRAAQTDTALAERERERERATYPAALHFSRHCTRAFSKTEYDMKFFGATSVGQLSDGGGAGAGVQSALSVPVLHSTGSSHSPSFS